MQGILPRFDQLGKTRTFLYSFNNRDATSASFLISASRVLYFSCLLQGLLVHFSQLFFGWQSLDRRSRNDGFSPLDKPCQLRVLVRGRELESMLEMLDHGYTGQERGQSQVGKGKLFAKEIVADTALAVSMSEQLVDLFQLRDKVLVALFCARLVDREGCLVVCRMGPGAPMLDQVADLGTLEWVRWKESF